MYSDYELYHHGVKGMKWGVRKEYKSAVKNADKPTKRMLKAQYKNDVAKNISLMKASGKDYAKNTSVGKKIAQSLILGIVPGIGYRRARGSGADRVEAYLATYLAGPWAGVAYRNIEARS